jgi:CHAT domain-containing protein/Flp pilus assembly protein TadD
MSVIRRSLGVLLVLLSFSSLSLTSLAEGRSTKSSNSESSPEPIAAGRPINAKLAGGEAHRYVLVLTANQYVDLRIGERGIDVVVTLISPDGNTVVIMNDPYRSEGVKHLLAISDVSGDYLVEVKAREQGAPIGEYSVKVDELRPATPVDHDRVRASSAFLKGNIFSVQVGPWGPSSLRAAIAEYEKALSLYRAIGDHSQDGKLLFRIGTAWNNLDEYRKAIRYFSDALSVIERQADNKLEADVRSQLGYVYLRLGESQNAIENSSKALALIRKRGDQRREAFILYSLGTIYYSLGSLEQSLQYLQETLVITRKINEKHFEAATLRALGRLYLDRGENQQAILYLSRSLQLSEELGDRGDQALGLSELAKAYMALGKMDQAWATSQKARELSSALSMRGVKAEVLNNLGTTYNLLGNYETALSVFRESLQQSRMIGDPRIEVEALYGIAKTQRAIGELVNSKHTIESAIPIVDSFRSKIESLEIRQGYFASVQKIYALYIDVLMQLHRSEPSKGFNALALRANEGIRARNLDEMLRSSNIDIRQSVDPSLLNEERRLQQALNELALRKMKVMGTKDEQQASAIAKSLEIIMSQYEALEAKIRQTNPRYAALRKPEPLTVANIQKLLDNDTVLLEYALGDERSFLWAVTPLSIRSYELPGKAVIEANARQLIEVLKYPQARQSKTAHGKTTYPELASRVSSVLLGPAAQELGKKRLLIVSDGILQFLPFGALPSPLNSGQPLILKHEIVYAPSASIVATLRYESEIRRSPSKTVAVFGDPVFDKDDERMTGGRTNQGTNVINTILATQDSETKPLELFRLPYSRLEAEAIVNLAPKGESMKAVGFAANKQAVTRGDLDQYRIVHFATHALIDSSQPELSGIVLSLYDENSTPQNGFLGLNEISNLNLSAELVVLSACRTGLGKDVRGEGVIGLARGFMHAGTSRVVVSLWSTDDRSNETLMNRFYYGMLRKGLTPAAALRAAQIEMWQEKRWSDPYYWAAFVLQGDW